uniref:Helicase C-terminal domain-containing protein n=1 Tax=Panagrolaimus superbus TaxID=310955 RepID=A0A914YHY6_9BILA
MLQNPLLGRYKIVLICKNEDWDFNELDPNDDLKIFIVTEVEGVNVPNVGLVIDCGMHKKHSEYSAAGKYKLQQFFGNEGTVLQRMGRTGRTCDGFYVIMLAVSHYEWMKIQPAERALDSNIVEVILIFIF